MSANYVQLNSLLLTMEQKNNNVENKTNFYYAESLKWNRRNDISEDKQKPHWLYESMQANE